MNAQLSSPSLSIARAWLELVWLSLRRQARMRQMLMVAVTLMILAVVLAAVISYFRGWSLHGSRPRPFAPTYQQSVNHMRAARMMAAPNDSFAGLLDAIDSSVQTALDHSAFLVFSRWIVFAI